MHQSLLKSIYKVIHIIIQLFWMISSPADESNKLQMCFRLCDNMLVC